MPPADNPYTVGQMIKLFRKAERETQKDLAKAIGVEVWKIKKIEQGNFNQDVSLLEKIAEHYDCPPVVLDPTVHGETNLDLFQEFQKLFAEILKARIIVKQGKDKASS